MNHTRAIHAVILAVTNVFQNSIRHALIATRIVHVTKHSIADQPNRVAQIIFFAVTVILSMM